jgi:hypothetical protein
MIYQMKTITADTRIRSKSDTGGSVLGLIPANVVISGKELFTATKQLTNSNGVVYQKPGDKWVRVTYNGILGWVAYIHMGGFICTDFVEIDDSVPVEPPIQEIAPSLDIVYNFESGAVTKHYVLSGE